MPRFHRLCMRDKLYNARRMIRQNSIDTKSLGFHQNHIYTNEYPSTIQWISTPTSTPLSKAQQRLFYKALKSKTTEGWKYAWTFHGQVFMRKTKSDDAVKITSELDLPMPPTQENPLPVEGNVSNSTKPTLLCNGQTELLCRY